MARGWESKSVESQIESAGNEKSVLKTNREANQPNPSEVERIRKKENLLLSRTRVLHQIESVQNPRYRSMLDRALVDLNAQLAELEGNPLRMAAAT